MTSKSPRQSSFLGCHEGACRSEALTQVGRERWTDGQGKAGLLSNRQSPGGEGSWEPRPTPPRFSTDTPSPSSGGPSAQAGEPGIQVCSAMLPVGGHLDQAGTTHQLCQTLGLDSPVEPRLRQHGSCGVALATAELSKQRGSEQKPGPRRGGREAKHTPSASLFLSPGPRGAQPRSGPSESSSSSSS